MVETDPMIESTSEIVAQIAALTKAITETHHGKALDYDEVQARLITIVSDHPIQNNNLLTSLDTLAAINGSFLSWLKSHMDCVTKHQLDEAKREILTEIKKQAIEGVKIQEIYDKVQSGKAKVQQAVDAASK